MMGAVSHVAQAKTKHVSLAVHTRSRMVAKIVGKLNHFHCQDWKQSNLNYFLLSFELLLRAVKLIVWYFIGYWYTICWALQLIQQIDSLLPLSDQSCFDLVWTQAKFELVLLIRFGVSFWLLQKVVTQWSLASPMILWNLASWLRSVLTTLFETVLRLSRLSQAACQVWSILRGWQSLALLFRLFQRSWR